MEPGTGSTAVKLKLKPEHGPKLVTYLTPRWREEEGRGPKRIPAISRATLELLPACDDDANACWNELEAADMSEYIYTRTNNEFLQFVHKYIPAVRKGRELSWLRS